MLVAVADTHAIVWYLSADQRLSARAKQFIDDAAQNDEQIAVSTITLIEMAYLIEKGRISAPQFSQRATELADPTSMFLEIPVSLKIARALTRVARVQIPDMPDRIIAATGLNYNVPIISRDRKIQHSALRTIW